MSGDEGQLLDAPNQQVVRADASAPWDEGTGGEAAPEAKSMTKAELLDAAAAAGVDADESMTKAQIQEAIEAG